MMKLRGLSVLVLVALASLSGCSGVTNALSGTKVDYKADNEGPQRNVLEVPPDLSTLPRDDRYNVPGANGTTTFSSYTQQRQNAAANPVAAGPQVLPQVAGAHLERAGGQRWLVVNRTPEQLWPLLRDFWQENGFLLKIDSPETGIMETDWEENRAKLPLDFIRRQLGHALDSIYDTGERDKFRTRLERRPDGGTEIYISHRGMVEVVTSQQNQTTVWTTRPSDPELEAEFMDRLLVKLGTDEARARAIVAQASPAALAGATVPGGLPQQPPQSKFVAGPAGSSYIELADPFDRAWRRVGLALDRVNFTVEDRDRTTGVYFVRYVDPDEDGGKDTRSMFGRIFSSDDPKKQAQQYRVQVKTEPDNATTHVTTLNKTGVPETGDAGTRILTLLNDQLK
jgi:outer membrane protein assembly factor BamC